MYKNCEIKIFALKSTEHFGREVCRAIRKPISECVDDGFPDGESYTRPKEDVRGKDVFVIQSLHGVGGESVDTKLNKLAIFNNAAKYASAARITDVIPYLAYTRQDRKDRSRAPLSSQMVADQLMSSGASRILSMDWHNPAIQNAYRVPVDILNPIGELVTYLKDKLKDEKKIVALAADVGAAERNDNLAVKLTKMLEREIGFAVVLKRRSGSKTESLDIVGDVRKAVTLIYDDESVTASTMIGAADKARSKGANYIVAILTHAKLKGEAIKKLSRSCLDEIVITDTIWRPRSFYEKNHKFKLVSVAPLFGEAIRRIHNSESISTLFE